MTKHALQTIQILPVHDSLKSTIEHFIDEDKESLTNGVEEEAVLREAMVFDFRVRCKLISQYSKDGSIVKYLHVFVPEWSNCKVDATKRLYSIYEDALILKAPDDTSFKEDYNFSINLNVATRYFDSIEECATTLSQIRIQSIGSPIFHAMERLVSENKNEEMGDDGTVRLIQSYPKCGECHCIGTNEKVMIIFTIMIEDEMERALAKLFLQQFVGAQKQVSQSPHCEFRRGNEPPMELLSLVDEIRNEDGLGSRPRSIPIGYLAFTFFPSHLKSLERREKAVALMVNFFPYIDKHLKSTKSYMHSRMRAKKDDLLRELKDTAKTSEKTKFGLISKKKKKKGGVNKPSQQLPMSPRLAVM